MGINKKIPVVSEQHKMLKMKSMINEEVYLEIKE